MKISICVLNLILTLPLHAVVVSSLSSESLFVCNAGISHVSNTSVFGTDSIAISFENTLVPLSSPARNLSTVLASQADNSPKYFASGNSLWTQLIDSMSYNLTTEKYGSTYFLEICYRGPEANQPAGPGTVDLSQGIYSLDLSVSLAESTNSSSTYHSDSQLSSQIDFVCDLRDRGQQTKARSTNDLAIPHLETDSLYSSGPIAWGTSSMNFQVALNDTYSSVPRFCKIRVLFQENALQSMRNTQLNLKDVDVFLNINQMQ